MHLQECPIIFNEIGREEPDRKFKATEEEEDSEVRFSYIVVAWNNKYNVN